MKNAEAKTKESKSVRETPKEKEVKYILDVPRSFIDYCIREASSPEKRREIEKVLEEQRA